MIFSVSLSIHSDFLAFFQCFIRPSTAVTRMFAVFVFVQQFRRRWQVFRQFPLMIGHSLFLFDIFNFISQFLQNKFRSQRHKVWWVESILRKNIYDQRWLCKAVKADVKDFVKRALQCNFRRYDFDTITRCDLESGNCFLESSQDYFRRCYLCGILHRWADLSCEDNFCFLGHFFHSANQFRCDRCVVDKNLDCHCGISFGTLLE